MRMGAMLYGFEGKVFTECLHAYAFDVFLEKSSEHVCWEAV